MSNCVVLARDDAATGTGEACGMGVVDGEPRTATRREALVRCALMRQAAAVDHRRRRGEVMGLMMFLVAWTRHKTITRVPRTRHAGTCKRAPWRCRSSDMRDGQLGNR